MSDPVQITCPTSGSTAEIAVDRGFNCFRYHAVNPASGLTLDVLDADPAFAEGAGRPSGHGIPILFPFPNRIRGGRYRWAETEYVIPAAVAADDGNGNAIHGFCLDRPWRVITLDENSVRAEFQLSVDAPDRLTFWPCDARIEICYRLDENGLLAEITIENPSGEHELPWGFGTHPYFRLPLEPGGDPAGCLVQVPAANQWELVDCLPTGNRLDVDENCDLREGCPFDQLQLDHVLTALKPAADGPLEMAILDERAGLSIRQRCDAGLFREVVVFTPPGRNAVCLEPYTCVTDAINLDASGETSGWQVLPPGGRLQAGIQLFAGAILV